jgi:hypothetical protein
MEDVCSIIRRIAYQADVSIDLIHHTVKDDGGDSEKHAGSMKAGRGASAIIGAVRFSYTLCRMNRKTSWSRYGVPEEQTGLYSRLDGAKASYAAHAGVPVWFEMQSVNIRDDAGDLTPLISSTGEALEDKDVPLRPPLTVGVHVPWVPLSDRQVAEAPTAAQAAVQAAAQAEQAKRDKQYELLRLVAEAMPRDRCHVADVLDAVMKQRGVGDTTARSLVKKAVLAANDGELFEVIRIGDRDCTLRLEREGHATKGPLWLVRDWGRFGIRVISGHKPREAETRHVVQQGSPFRTPKSFRYLVENTRLVDDHRRNHFRTPR